MVHIRQKVMRIQLGQLKTLVLVVPMGGGVKAQYPVQDEREAMQICQQLLAMNPDLMDTFLSTQMSA